MPKRIPYEKLFADELLSIQPSGNQFYVEIQSIQWSGEFPTADEALDAALDMIDKVVEEGGSTRDEIAEYIKFYAAELEGHLKKAKELQQKIADLSAFKVEDLSIEQEIREQAPGIKRWLALFFGGDGPTKGHRRVGILPYKDFDGDGDMDVKFSTSSSRKRLVE